VGRELAGRLGLRFADSDAEVVIRAGRSIQEIFATDGEGAFRALEREAIEILAGQDGVVGLGGGAMAQPGVPARLAATGTVVYLRAAPTTLLERVGSCEGRPLLAGLVPSERAKRLESLLRDREPVYETADVVIDTDGLSVAEVAEALVRELRED
jgi:shikimate kinase